MGGHGGLNILPQKRWNVYNFDNREKVRRDEEEAAREEQIRQQKAKREETEFKLEKLRQVAQSKRRKVEQGTSAFHGEEGDGAIISNDVDSVDGRLARNDGAEMPQHINLFAEFEAREKEGHGRVQERGKDRNDGKRERRGRGESQGHKDGKQVEKKDGKPTGEAADDHYRLGYGANGKNGKKPWYAIKSFMVERARIEEEDRPDMKLRNADTIEDKPAKSKTTSEKLRAYRIEENPAKSKKTIEELRAERTNREKQERDKARRVVLAKAGTSSNNGYNRLPDGRLPHYHASFGNAR